MLILYTLTLFLSASLLFVVQPMFTRLVVPLLGGSPGVWNAGQAFFQIALLCGYAYAHISSKRLKSRWQIALHLALGLSPLLLLILPIHIPIGWTPPTDTNPLPWLLGLLTVAVGLPFFVLAATTPLLQHWFSRSGHPSAADPYFLYAASNAGSLLALLSYPTLIEPNLRLTEQNWAWMGGYVLLIGLIVACAVLVWRRKQTPETETPTTAEHPTPVENGAITHRRRIRWVLLAVAPVSLMLSVVTYISSDIAAIPLLWVVPLAIYLLTFIFVFARKPIIPHKWIVALAPIVALVLIWVVVVKSGQWAFLSIGIQLLALFVIAMLCHGELAADRPGVSGLTEFYMWLSFGGVLAGVFNALIAPVIFTSIVEYPLTLVLVGLLLPKPKPSQKKKVDPRLKRRADTSFSIPEKYRWMLDLALPVLLFGITALLAVFLQATTLGVFAVIVGVPALVCFFFRQHPVRFGLGIGAIFLAAALFVNEGGQSLYAERSFFGVHRVFALSGNTYHLLMHGNTIHGIQSKDATWRKVPLTYYYPNGPLGQIFEARTDDATQRKVAVVGLGSGSIACYAQPGGAKLPQAATSGATDQGSGGQNWTFYEIDPIVEHIARDPRYFTYLQDCAPNAKIVLGDGRLSLASVPAGEYDMIIFDAFSSDAIPVHLLTREALQLYLDKLAPGGFLVFHLTSRHFNLDPVIGDLARDAGLTAKVWADTNVKPTDFDFAQGKRASTWAVITRTPADLGKLANDPRWVVPQSQPNARVWTDDFASLLSVLK